MDGYNHPFFSKVDSSSLKQESFPMPTFGSHESWLNPFYKESDYVQSLEGVRKQNEENGTNSSHCLSSHPPVAKKRSISKPFSGSRLQDHKFEPKKDLLGFSISATKRQEVAEMNSKNLINGASDSGLYENNKPSTSSSARARREENLANKSAYPVVATSVILDPPIAAPPTPSSISDRIAQVAQTIKNKLNPQKPQRGSLVDDTLAAMTIATDDDTLVPIEFVPYNMNDWPKTAGPRPDYGPTWGNEIAVDFQSYRDKLPTGNLFQRRLFYDVLVTSAESPENFTIQNLGTSYALNYMEENMKEWYDAYWIESANIDPKIIYKGCYYAGYIEDKETWHRIRVEEYVPDSRDRRTDRKMELLVRLMDYGTTAIMAQDCILPLRRVYGKLPLQVAQASLQTVANSHPWKPTEVEQFKLDVVGKIFQAFITDCNRHESEDYDNLTVVLLEDVGTVNERPYSLGDFCETTTK